MQVMEIMMILIKVVSIKIKDDNIGDNVMAKLN